MKETVEESTIKTNSKEWSSMVLLIHCDSIDVLASSTNIK